MIHDPREADSILIERAHPSDLPDVLALLERSRLPEAGLGDHLVSLLVARRQGTLVGCAGLELYGNEALLRSVAVDPLLRGHGLGQRLTAAALDLARQRGVRAVYLLTETAAGFFPRFGFRTVPRASVEGPVTGSVEFTTACPSTAVVMVLELEAG